MRSRKLVEGGASIEIVKFNVLAAIDGRRALASGNTTKTIKEVNG